MTDPHDSRRIVEEIRKEIELSKGTRIWGDYINALKLIAQVVFTRSSGFILELIQNAEDAGLGLESPGTFEIGINEQRVKVVHNGRLFSEGDVKSLCGIRSSKKPENGTLGYLGIGFKSVFKVTDCPEVYSGAFRFKYDRDAWEDPSNTPWHVLPIWIESSETTDPDKTTFIIPFRDESYYESLLQEMAKLKTELYLFLRWMKSIEIVDEMSGRSWILENMGEGKDDITTLRQDFKMQKFKFFRRTCQVPDWVKADRLTQEYRANVTKREIAIAFAIDDSNNLAPFHAGAMYGGVYSFLPLGEAKSGAKFPIQADFLVQPGRDAINYEAKWNHWLVGEVASLCEEAVDCFKKHEKWKYQFIPALAFTRTKGLESHDSLFGPKLMDPVDKFIQESDCVPLLYGGWAKPCEVVRLTETEAAIEDLVTMGVLDKDKIASVVGGRDGLKLAHHAIQDTYPQLILQVDRQGLLDNDAFLEAKRLQTDAANWFLELYLWLAKYPAMYKSGRKWLVKGYHQAEFVLTANGKLSKGGDVWLPDLPASDPLLKGLSDTLQKTRPILHPEILAGAKDEPERKILRGFLLGLSGVQVLDAKKICEETLLPQIAASAPKPTEGDLLRYTAYCQRILVPELCRGTGLWILTKKGEIRPAGEVFFPKEFKPEQDWEANQRYVSGLNIVSPAYISGVSDEDQLRQWREFFESGGVNDAPNGGVEEFAVNYAMEKLRGKYKSLTVVDKRKFGYDVEGETDTGNRIHVEVKGQSHDQNVELKDNELDAADMYKDSFYLCVVTSIPESPAMHMVKNPAAPGVGKKDKLTITVDIWKTSKWSS